MKCKICGTASFADLKCAIDAGADAVGFLVGMPDSIEDAVSTELARAMISSLPPFVTPVAVTHLQKTDELIRIVKETGCSALQIQNEIEPKDIFTIKKVLPYLKIIKAIHITSRECIDNAILFAKYADTLILDTKANGKIGGTGITHDWNISAEIVEKVSVPVILAGGLTPENLTEAIETVHPFAVDVHTGVKKSGVRDAEKTCRFVETAHNSE
ncbi:MAG TPA: phosphoribosylanthranilate isomerase [Methanocorpusculum sp.]|nr:phosphoribosylanthranilate isomerase [Methanocorpusculum sp.]